MGLSDNHVFSFAVNDVIIIYSLINLQQQQKSLINNVFFKVNYFIVKKRGKTKKFLNGFSFSMESNFLKSIFFLHRKYIISVSN